MKTFKEIEQVLQKITPGKELEAFDFLESAARIIVDEPVREIIVQGIRVRKKWKQIKLEYDQIKGEIGSKESVSVLSKKFHYSEKTIESIIYER